MSTAALPRRNLIVLTIAQALGASGPPIVVSLGGIVGQMLSPDPALVTLPVSVFSLGVAAGTLPAATLMRRVGRRGGYLTGAATGTAAGLLAAFGIYQASFLLFCLGTFAAGFYAAFVQSYRFAATDALAGAHRAKAISWVMVGGLAAAVIGPQLVIWTREWTATPFAGSFVSQALLAALAIPILAMLRSPPVPQETEAANSGGGRPLHEILRSGRFILAASAGLVSYGLMSFVMTASPVAMVGCGFTIGQAALGIQWHILAMFGPSFFTGNLIARFGKEKVTAAGLLLIAASAGTALAGIALLNFWLSLILLGLGWNLSFIGATAMVTECHTPEERTKVQGANDFLIFGSVAAASFASGTLLTQAGWDAVNWMIFPAVGLVLIPLLWRLPSARRAKPA